MSDPVFASASSGCLTGLSSIAIQRADIYKDYTIYDTTAACDGSAARHTASQLYQFYMQGFGFYIAAPSIYAKLGGVARPTVTNWDGFVQNTIRFSSATLQKRVNLFHVTAAGDNSAMTHPVVQYWAAGVKVYHGVAQGLIQSTETPLYSETQQDASSSSSGGSMTSQRLVLPIGNSASVSGEVVFDRIGNGANFQGGGPINWKNTFRFTHGVTPGGPFSTDSFSAVANLNNGQVMTGTLMIREMSANLDYASGGVVPFRFAGPFSGAVAFA